MINSGAPPVGTLLDTIPLLINFLTCRILGLHACVKYKNLYSTHLSRPKMGDIFGPSAQSIEPNFLSIGCRIFDSQNSFKGVSFAQRPLPQWHALREGGSVLFSIHLLSNVNTHRWKIHSDWSRPYRGAAHQNWRGTSASIKTFLVCTSNTV